MVNLIVIHFQPIEYYPPTHNFLKYVDERNDLSVTVLTTKNGKGIQPYTYKNVHVERLSHVDGKTSRFARLFSIIRFNLLAVFMVLRKSFDCLYFYETWSVFPALIAKTVASKDKRFYAHFHEYTSNVQLNSNETFIFRQLYRVEKKLMPTMNWVSHTNMHRMELYKIDVPNLRLESCKIQPNYPPLEWQSNITPTDIANNDPLKLVYVGSLSSQNMYFEEVVTWVESHNGSISLDLYSINLNKDVQSFLEKHKIQHTQVKSKVLYDDLPHVLSKYDIGLVIYNGGNLNYVYNAPNKLFEYHICGLDIWFSSDLKTSFNYKTTDTYPKIVDVDFKDLLSFDYKTALNREHLQLKIHKYTSEQVYSVIVDDFTNESTHPKL